MPLRYNVKPISIWDTPEQREGIEELSRFAQDSDLFVEVSWLTTCLMSLVIYNNITWRPAIYVIVILHTEKEDYKKAN